MFNYDFEIQIELSFLKFRNSLKMTLVNPDPEYHWILALMCDPAKKDGFTLFAYGATCAYKKVNGQYVSLPTVKPFCGITKAKDAEYNSNNSKCEYYRCCRTNDPTTCRPFS